MGDVALKCRCGKVRGRALDVTRETGNRAICYCRDCQAFARFLGQGGIVDDHGGSDIFQVTPSQLRIDEGASELACMKLGPKGLLRWYTACCKTPIANVATSARLPFAGVIQPFMDHEGRSRDEDIGKPRMIIHTQSAVNGKPVGDTKLRMSTVAHMLGLLGSGLLRGKHRPSPFFDDKGDPVATPTVLTLEARKALY